MATKYNFDRNLIKASYKKDLYGAKREWQILTKETREREDGLCICQRKVKHIIYMYNPKTKLTIIIGSKCAKKFELNDAKPLPNNILKEILSKSLEKGEYEIIDNIIRYSNNIEEQIIKYFQNKIDSINNQNKLLDIQNEIKELIDVYSLKYLNNIYETLNNKIIKMNIHKELTTNFLVYSVKTFTHNYMPGQGSDIYENIKSFRNIDECNNYILSLKPLGQKITKGYGYTLSEDTLKKIEIIYKNNIIKTFGKLYDENTISRIEIYQNYNENTNIEEVKTYLDTQVFICNKCNTTTKCDCRISIEKSYKLNDKYICLNCNICNKCNDSR